MEIGTHDALMDAQGAYYQLYQAQIRQAAELVEGGAIGDTVQENEDVQQEESLQMMAKNLGGGV